MAPRSLASRLLSLSPPVSPAPGPGPLSEIVEITGKGLGTRALKNLRAGKEVFSEFAQVFSEECTPLDIYQSVVGLDSQDPRRWAWYLTLTHVGQLPYLQQETGAQRATTPTADRKRTRLEVYADNMHRTTKLFDEQTKRTIRLKTGARYYAIFMNNAFKMKVGEGRVAKGMFERASRLNHSCAPNCYASWNQEIKKLCVHTLQPIMSGEELTIAYDPDEVLFQDRETRKQLLNDRYGFSSTCSVCEDSHFSNLNEWSRRDIAALKTQIDSFHRTGGEATPIESLY